MDFKMEDRERDTQLQSERETGREMKSTQKHEQSNERMIKFAGVQNK